MSKSINEVRILGRIGNNPELRQLPDGKSVVSFSVATNKTFKNDDGVVKEYTTWHSLTAFGKRADLIFEYVKKGQQHMFTGSLRTNEWEKEGQKHYSTEIIVDDIFLLNNTPRREAEAEAEAVAEAEAEDLGYQEMPKK